MADPYGPALAGEGHIWFVGDPHGFFARFMPTIERGQPDAVVLLGDLELDQAWADEFSQWDYNPSKIWFIHGNHDCDRLNYWSRLPADRNLNGRVLEIAGRRVGGLVGVFRGKIWDGHTGPNPVFSTHDYLERQPPRDRSLPLKHHASIIPAQIHRLMSQNAEILVTHEAPSCHWHGHPALDELADAMHVHRLFHGHHHVTYERLLPSGVFVHGVDMAGIVDDEGREILARLSTPPVQVPTSLSEAWRRWEQAEQAPEIPISAAGLLAGDDDET